MRKIVAVLATAVLITGAFFATTFKAAAAPQKLSVSKKIVDRVSSASRSFPRVILNLSPAAQTYQVRSGDSLSSISARQYGKASDWPVLYWANRNTIRWANIISVGLALKVPPLPGVIPAVPSELSPPVHTLAKVLATTRSGSYGHPNFCGDDDGDGWDVSCPSSTVAATPDKPAYAGAATYSGTTSFQQCVISRESGGNSQVMNSSGHYGLYQFSYSTWVAYGGSSAAFGHASVSQQNQVFASAMATPGGASNWSPYDGC